MTIAIYTTAHGYGHTSRSFEVARTLVESDHEIRVYFMTNVPDNFFAGQEHPGISRRKLRLDAGIKQIDSLRMDLSGTLEDLNQLEAESEDLLGVEIAFLRQAEVDLVLSDLPYLTFEAAERAGIPAWGLSNFTWDWIYEAYIEYFPELQPHIARIRRAYSTAQGIFRLPFYGGFDAFRRIMDIPLVARKSKLSRDEVRRVLGWEAQEEIVLFSFGGHSADFRVPGNSQGIRLISTDPQADPGLPFTHISNERLVNLGLRYCDLVAAADAVISKPGYGIVSECIANRTALLYTPRGNFREYPILVEQMKEFIPAMEISLDDLRKGSWLDAYVRLRGISFPPVTACNGAEVLVEKLLEECLNH